MMCWSTGGPERFGSSPELRSCSSLEELQRSQKKNHPGSIGQRAKPPSLEVLDRKLDERMATAREHHLMSLRYGPCLPPSQCSILLILTSLYKLNFYGILWFIKYRVENYKEWMPFSSFQVQYYLIQWKISKIEHCAAYTHNVHTYTTPQKNPQQRKSKDLD